MSNSTSFPQSQPSEPVKGVAIFWPLLSLALASVLHPLGSTCGESSPRYRYYMRALPLSGFLDSLYFLSRCRDDGSTTSVLARLDENNPNLIQQYYSKHEDNSEHINAFLDFFVDFKARLFPGMFILLAYVKLCTFSGVPGALALGSLYFLSWFILEGMLIAQHFRGVVVKTGSLKRATTWPRTENGRLSIEQVRILNRLLVFLQVLAFICIGIVVLVRRTRRNEPHHPARPTIHFFAVLKWFFIPTRNVFRWGLTFIEGVNEKYMSLHNFFLILLYFYFILLPRMFVAFISVILTFIINSLVVPFLFWGLYMLYHHYEFLQWAPKLALRPVFILGYVKAFCFIFLGSSIAYYATLYDSNGVSTKAWNDILG